MKEVKKDGNEKGKRGEERKDEEKLLFFFGRK